MPPSKSSYSKDLRTSRKTKKFGFTLAEVLITLTIIGVIAAMTVPTLINNNQKQQFVVGLQKAYATLSNAVQMIPLTEGCSAGDYECASIKTNSNSTDIFNINLLLKQYKVVKQNMGFNDEPECVALGKTFHDGAVACFTTTIGSSNGIYIDVNGAKGPNQAGRDQFEFEIALQTQNGVNIRTVLPAGSAIAAQYSNDPDVYWRNNGKCPKNASTEPWEVGYCTGRVLEEGKMNY